MELTEAINSMFRWYKHAARCYAYLSDVSTNDCVGQQGQPNPAWEAAFRKSRWFTRGWTLQELLAPSSVDFFSIEGKWLGTKFSLEGMIHETTGVRRNALTAVKL